MLDTNNMDYEKEYRRFIVEISSFILLNRYKLKQRIVNIFVDENKFWAEIDVDNYVNLMERPYLDKKIIDPVISFNGGEIIHLFMDNEDDLDDDEYDKYIGSTSKKVQDYLKEEVPYEVFSRWLEFSELIE
jgi:hypothetical protein